MLKTLGYYIDLSLMSEGLFLIPQILFDRIKFHLFYKNYYKRKFKSYGDNVTWGKYLWRKTIPCSIRIANPHLISIGNNCQIEEYVYLQANENGEGIHLDDEVRINAHVHVLAGGKIHLENKVLVAPFSLIASINHGTEIHSPIIEQGMKLTSGIKVGSGSWIGQRSVLLGGTAICSNSTVAAGTIINKTFTESGLLVGVPVRLVKK